MKSLRSVWRFVYSIKLKKKLNKKRRSKCIKTSNSPSSKTQFFHFKTVSIFFILFQHHNFNLISSAANVSMHLHISRYDWKSCNYKQSSPLTILHAFRKSVQQPRVAHISGSQKMHEGIAQSEIERKQEEITHAELSDEEVTIWPYGYVAVNGIMTLWTSSQVFALRVLDGDKLQTPSMD